MTEVLIAGAGPAGLLLAVELRHAGVTTVLVERQPRRPEFCRAFTLNARALDLLARRGLAEPLIAEGWPVPHAASSGLPVTLGLAGTHTDHPYTLGIPQTRVEEVLEEHARELGADIRRGHDLRTLEQDDEGVTATVATGDGEYRLRAAYLAGCDGGRSTVRKQAGIDFPGTPSTRFWLLGDVELADPAALPFGPTAGPGGTVIVIPRDGYVRVLVEDHGDTPVTLERLQSVVDGALGRHVELRAARWVTRFGNAARQATDYVRGRVVLAGDAAHIHPPAGAIGVNAAIDDAFNLGWKLAATLRDPSTGLLASYHAERHRAGAHLLANTRAQVLFGDADERLGPLIDLFTRVAAHPYGNRALTEVLTGLDTRYDTVPETGHPWLGRLVPNLALTTADGPTDLVTLQRTGRWLLLDLSPAGDLAGEGVDVVHAACPEHPGLRAVLLRPDGHAAWIGTTGDPDPDGLRRALRHRLGPLASAGTSEKVRR
ncbi:FAD-dependent monooxygenase [Actinoplanes sp. NPDC051851]|uniref:FAD-dependent monooxygenase n=1 Tax=Actinoplanes sp. NPDC051851 TaxID=3154753 RepID=UPI0034397427